jgi:carboxymethylenebutenolidase
MRGAILFFFGRFGQDGYFRRRYPGAATALVLVLACFPGLAAETPAGVAHEFDREEVQPLAGRDRRIRSAVGDRVELYVSGDPGSSRAVLLFHEWWGLTDPVRAEADRYASLGYYAAALNVYGKPPTGNPRVARRNMRELDTRVARRRARAALDFLAGDGRRVAVLGWCFGGGQALDAAIESPARVAAAVAYYGDLETDPERLSRLQAPVLAIFADRDRWITPERAGAFREAMAAAGRPLEFASYAAGHAFANPTARDYDGAVAAEARALADAFIARHLASGAPGATQSREVP